MSNGNSVANEVLGPALLNTHDRSDSVGISKGNEASAALKDARLSQGIDIATLASLLKVPAHKLQALEQGRFEKLPDPVFTRALASSMCRILKLDPAPVLRQLPPITTFKAIPQNRGINTPFRARVSSQAVPVRHQLSIPAIWLGLVLLASALVLFFLPSIEPEFSWLRHAKQVVGSPFQVAQLTPGAITVVTPVSGSDRLQAGIENFASGNPVASEIAVLAPGPATLPTPPLLTDTIAAASKPTVTFRAKSTSNVKVTDGGDTIVFDRVLRSGESASLSGLLPLSIVVSRASAVQVQVRGEAFDLGVVSKNNVARFEVK